MTMEPKLIDHILLSLDATTKQIEGLCAEAKEYNFCSACISPCQIETATRCLKGSDVKVCIVIRFPSGVYVTDIKSAETKQVVTDGAQEIDMAINMGAIKEGNWEHVKNDIAAVVETTEKETFVKVILETCLLADEEIVEACKRAQAAGADFVKASAGFSRAGVTTGAAALMRKVVGDTIEVKAMGGICTPKTFKAAATVDANRTRVPVGIELIGGA